MNENLRELRKVLTAVEEKKDSLEASETCRYAWRYPIGSRYRRGEGALLLSRKWTSPARSYSVSRRLAEPLKDHIDNNFQPVESGTER